MDRCSYYFIIISTYVFALLFITTTNATDCSPNFHAEVLKRKIETCKKLTNGVEFGWKYTNSTRRLDVMIGAKLEAQTGWLAWGLNPEREPKMVGTQAIILVKLENGTLNCDKYNVTENVKKGCVSLVPSKIDLDVRELYCNYGAEQLGYHVIKAAIVNLPSTYNVSRLNHVWQIGDAAQGVVPLRHHLTLRNFDSAETFDVYNGKLQSFIARKRHQMRLVHGIFNIAGWGTLLPVGVIAARYFKKFPFEGKYWFRVHVGCQIMGYILGVIGWAIGLWLGQASKYYKFRTHRLTAIFIFTFATLQMLALRLKPDRMDEYRKHWNKYHHFMGYALLAVICYNIFKGISVLNQYDGWRTAYAVIIAVLVAIFIGCELCTWKTFIHSKKLPAKTTINPTKHFGPHSNAGSGGGGGGEGESDDSSILCQKP